jgi:UDP-N-acetylglucosamine diphosphorylase / glucose-1-phosphate thymidylyltransferase / UDP-N-acetylgalactosamine diphosphorylase / glucosamine-1-phosphate N-acetyltransferase / galactosamine-1-phosphate N-acetyltransferase
MTPVITLTQFVANPPPAWESLAPWQLTQSAPDHIATAIAAAPQDFIRTDGNAIHNTAIIEPGAALKGPIYIGPRCFVASSALLRGGVWLEEDVIIGPACEIKTSFFFSGSKAAHLNFVGDSVIGHAVNIEVGAMLANYRNEKDDKRIRIMHNGTLIDTDVEKFGTLAGDHTKIGANAVIAPGAILEQGTIVKRLQLVDQSV